MRYAIIIPDGAADRPRPGLGGKTPLEAARLTAIPKLAREGTILSAQTVPEGYPPGSDVANLSVLGYNPADCYTGRAPLEAASIGISLEPGQAVFRANTVTIEDGIMRDYAAGHVSTEEALACIAHVDAHLNIPGAKLHGGIQYRHACVLDDAAGRVGAATPPHDILEQPTEPHQPTGESAERLIAVMERSRELLADFEVNRRRIEAGKLPVTQLWLWGGGTMPSLASFHERYRVKGGVITAVDLIRGIGILADLEVIPVEGATGYYDTNYKGKAEAALDCLSRSDLVIVHMESPDEAGHNADEAEKVTALENIDRLVVAPILEEAERAGDIRILLMPDHPTPLELRTHTTDPVPACLWGPGFPAEGPDTFSEAAIAPLAPEVGHTLLDRLIRT
ncbi:MAG: cofactor-independent phosphoglycerate mutase [Planctomycetota bacterium]|jgi:2,3-bisphosphoglycerate-independent phosphoglycerate mutase